VTRREWHHDPNCSALAVTALGVDPPLYAGAFGLDEPSSDEPLAAVDT
jgi:hypothetical protein